MIDILQNIFTGSILIALFSVLIVLGFGPAFIEVRDWYRLKKKLEKDTEYEQKHGFKPHKKTGGHF